MSDRTQETVPVQLTKPRTTSFIRESFTSNFWMSGLAMLKYIPRYFRVKQVDGMAFFTEAKLHEFRDRALRITPANPRQWGTMTVAQMLHHLNLACGGSLGFYELPDEKLSRLAHSISMDSRGLVSRSNQSGCGFRRDSRSPTTQRLTSNSKSSNC